MLTKFETNIFLLLVIYTCCHSNLHYVFMGKRCNKKVEILIRSFRQFKDIQLLYITNDSS